MSSTTEMLAKMKKDESSIKNEEAFAPEARSKSPSQTLAQSKPEDMKNLMEMCLNQKKEPKLTPNS